MILGQFFCSFVSQDPPLYLLQIKRHFLLQLDRCHKPSEPRYAHKSVLFSRSYLVLSFEKFQKLPSTQDGVKPTRLVCSPMYIQLGTFPVCSSTSSKKLSSSKLPMLTRFPRYFLTQLSFASYHVFSKLGGMQQQNCKLAIQPPQHPLFERNNPKRKFQDLSQVSVTSNFQKNLQRRFSFISR